MRLELTLAGPQPTVQPLHYPPIAGGRIGLPSQGYEPQPCTSSPAIFYIVTALFAVNSSILL